MVTYPFFGACRFLKANRYRIQVISCWARWSGNEQVIDEQKGRRYGQCYGVERRLEHTFRFSHWVSLLTSQLALSAFARQSRLSGQYKRFSFSTLIYRTRLVYGGLCYCHLAFFLNRWLKWKWRKKSPWCRECPFGIRRRSHTTETETF